MNNFGTFILAMLHKNHREVYLTAKTINAAGQCAQAMGQFE